MVEKRIILFVSFAVIVVIAASVGFYEFGLYNGEASGFRSGFAQGASSILIQPMTEIDLEPNQTVLVIPNLALVAPNFPPPNNIINLSYSFAVITPFSKNGTVEMSFGTFSTGYRSYISGTVSLNMTQAKGLNIFFRANPTNGGEVVLDFNSPLQMFLN